jgi:hypothetical protein
VAEHGEANEGQRCQVKAAISLLKMYVWHLLDEALPPKNN